MVRWAARLLLGLVLLAGPVAVSAAPAVPFDGRFEWSEPAQAHGLVAPAATGGDVVARAVFPGGPTAGGEPLASSDQVEVIVHRYSRFESGPMIEDLPLPRNPHVESERLLGNVTLFFETPFGVPEVYADGPARDPDAGPRVTAAECLLEPSAADRAGFPRSGSPVMVGDVASRALRAQCSAGSFSWLDAGRAVFFGMDLLLRSDEGGQERVRTGTWHEQAPQPSGLMTIRGDRDAALWRVTQLLELRRAAAPLRLDAPEETDVTLHADAFAVEGDVAVPASTGDVSWGPWRARGAVEPLVVRGAFLVEDDAGAVRIRGWSWDGPSASSVTGRAPAAWQVPVAAAVGVGVLAWLVRVAWPLFSRLVTPDVLGHPRRQAILEWVRREPGSETGEVARALGIRWSKIAYHVARLESAGHLVVRRVGGRTALFPVAGYRGREAGVALLRRASHRRVAHLVRERGVATQDELAAALGRHQSQVSRLLGDLERAGVVTSTRDGRVRRYRVAADVAAE